MLPSGAAAAATADFGEIIKLVILANQFFGLLVPCSVCQGKFSKNRFAAAAAPDGSIALYYLLTQKPITINMALFCAPVYASWFNPASGMQTPIAETASPNKGRTKFTPPSKNADGDNDWVLVLQTKHI